MSGIGTILLSMIAATLQGWVPPGLTGEPVPELTQQAVAATVQAEVSSTIEAEPERSIESTLGKSSLILEGFESFEQLPYRFLDVDVKNFRLSVRFYAPSDSDWGYGIAFRSNHATNANEKVKAEYRLMIGSEGQWDFGMIEDATTYPIITTNFHQHGSAAHLDAGATSSNTIDLIVIDETAYLYINGYYTATLDLNNTSDSDLAFIDGPGDIVIFLLPTFVESVGESVHYEIRRLDSLDPHAPGV